MRASSVFPGFFSSDSPWRVQVLAPVLVVIGLWIFMSGSTTFYLWWVEDSYDHVFSENLTSISAAHEVESLVWQTLAEWNDASLDTEKFQLLWSQRDAMIQDLLQQASLNARTEKEIHAETAFRLSVEKTCQSIATELQIWLTTGQRNQQGAQGIQMMVQEVSASAEKLRQINDELIAESRSQLAGTHSLVIILRLMMLLFGPLLGIYLGWRVAHRLQNSVAEIAVTLNESDLLDSTHELRVSITKVSSIDDVRRQAERVVERLRAVGLELQTARREIIQAERLAAVGELAAGVAHELRNPLTSVKLLLQHASRQSGDFKLANSQLQLILDEVRRMEQTIQGLLEFSRTPTLNRMPHDLRETLRRSINLVDGRLRQDHIVLHATICDVPLIVNGDAEQLNQVFVNLFLNSIEAINNGGSLHVLADLSESSRSARIVVRDSGCGISSELMARLFEPFATTKERGTGLGLAISRRIVVDHRGSISAENLPGKGAVFTVELPLASECA